MSDNNYKSSKGVVAKDLIENLKWAANANAKSNDLHNQKLARTYNQYIPFIMDKLNNQLNQKVDAAKLWKEFKAFSKSFTKNNQFTLFI